MAFNGNFLCTSFKVELMKGVHNFTAASNQFKLALYDNSATFTAATTAYTSTNEISGTNYTAKGNFLTSITPVAASLNIKAPLTADIVTVEKTSSAKSAKAVVPLATGVTLVKKFPLAV